MARGQVTFSAACTQPRQGAVYLLLDSPTISAQSIVGIAKVNDNGVGAVSRRFTWNPIFGGNGTTIIRSAAATPHTFFLAGGRKL